MDSLFTEKIPLFQLASCVNAWTTENNVAIEKGGSFETSGSDVPLMSVANGFTLNEPWT